MLINIMCTIILLYCPYLYESMFEKSFLPSVVCPILREKWLVSQMKVDDKY